MQRTISVTATDLSGNLLPECPAARARRSEARPPRRSRRPANGLTAPYGDNGTAIGRGNELRHRRWSAASVILAPADLRVSGSAPCRRSLRSRPGSSKVPTPIHDPVTGITLGELDIPKAAALIPMPSQSTHPVASAATGSTQTTVSATTQVTATPTASNSSTPVVSTVNTTLASNSPAVTSTTTIAPPTTATTTITTTTPLPPVLDPDDGCDPTTTRDTFDDDRDRPGDTRRRQIAQRVPGTRSNGSGRLADRFDDEFDDDAASRA